MNKIYFNNDGWVLNRYPHTNEEINKNRFIEVDDETFNKTFATPLHFAWRVVNGQLTNERYEETPQEEVLAELRNKRETECFSVVNRGQIWYDTLSSEQKQELKNWYQAWLDVTGTKTIPAKPNWLN